MKLGLGVYFFFCFNFGFCQSKAINISDRTNLPNAVYDSLKIFDIILCGEFHGSNESPQFIEGLVNLWLKNDQKVILALEIEENNQLFVDSFLSTGDFSIIHKMPHFNTKVKDGRSSKAMAELLSKMYMQKNLSVFCFDTNAKYRNGQERDSLMAINLSKNILMHPEYKTILLAGNIHSMLKKGYWNNPDYKTMGYFLSLNNKLCNLKMTSLNIIYGSGFIWHCRDDNGGVHPLYPDNMDRYNRYNEYRQEDNYFFWDHSGNELIDYLPGYAGFLASKYISASRPLNELFYFTVFSFIE